MKILVINCGSSSLKYQLINMEDESVICKGICERIGIEGSFIKHEANGGKWISQAWVSPVEITAKGVKAVRIDLNKYTNEYGRIDELDCRDAIWEICGRR